MAIKYQYNKTSLTNLGKQLKIRQKALPTLKNKESALRMSVISAKSAAEQHRTELEQALKSYDDFCALWNEFDPGLIRIVDVDIETFKVAGINVPKLGEIHYELTPFNAFVKPSWYPDGISILKDLTRIVMLEEVARKRSEILEYNRKKTTQKVNLYEKVQIPGFHEAILKIKRYMEDEENLSKAASKLVKNRHEAEEAQEVTV